MSNIKTKLGFSTIPTGMLKRSVSCLAISCIALGGLPYASAAGGGEKKAPEAWWNKAWSSRIEVVVDTGKDGFEITEDIGAVPVLLRLVEGSFSFSNAAEDGSDIRFLSDDGKKVLPSHIEYFDPMYGEGFAWVFAESIKPKAVNRIWLYSGATDTSDAPLAEAAERYSSDTVLVYHFNDRGAPPSDSSGNGNTATNAPAVVNGALIGAGARYTGTNPTIIPNSDSLTWAEGQEFTFSGWIKPFSLAPKSVIFRRAEGGNGLVIGINEGVPYISLTKDGSTTTTQPGEPIAAATWHHIGMSAGSEGIVLYVNGSEYARLPGTLSASAAQIELGGSTDGGAVGFSGEVDEICFIKATRPAGWFRFVCTNQGGSEASNRLVRFGQIEEVGTLGKNETLEHVMLFGDIAKNMMFDGWIAVGICVLMMIAGWSVAVKKTMYIGKIEKGNEAFLKEWHKVSSDLTILDAGEDGKPPEVFRHLGRRTLAMIKQSPLYHIYHTGSEEIRHRLGGGKNRGQGLSARSLQAIRAALDSSMVREQHRMSSGLVFLTISIAGGPYVGLLGTVVGVMITFALIAKTGDVEVNSIAPGIASALLATTVGLLVAIPALFIYSFLNSRIKQVTSNMQLFIDEFVAKVAEFYPPPAEVTPSSPSATDNGERGEVTASQPPDTRLSAALPSSGHFETPDAGSAFVRKKAEEKSGSRTPEVSAQPALDQGDWPEAAPVSYAPPPSSSKTTHLSVQETKNVSPSSPSLLAAALAAVSKQQSVGEPLSASRQPRPPGQLTPGKPIEKLPPPRPSLDANDDEDFEEEEEYEEDEDFDSDANDQQNGDER